MELRGRVPRAACSWLIKCLTLLILAPVASTQDSFAFLQPVSNPVQCQTYAFAWTGGTPTYKLQVSVNNGSWGKAYGISGIGGAGFPWTIPVPAGYSINFELFDSASHVAGAGPLTIQPSDDASCLDTPAPAPLNNSTTTTSSTTTSPTTTSSTTTSSTTTSSTTTTSPTPTPTATPTSAPSSSTSSSTTTSSSLMSLSFTPFTISSPSTSQSQTTTSGNGSTPVVETITAIPTTTSPGNVSPTPHHTALSTGAIAGVAVGGAAVVVLAGFLLWFCCKRRQSSFEAETESDKPTDSDTTSRLRFGGPQMSGEAMTSMSQHRLGPRAGPLPVPSPSSSSGSESDPFASSDGDGSRQLLLPTGSEDYVPASDSYHGQWDGTAAHPRNVSLLPSPPVAIGIPNVDDGMPKPSVRVVDDTLASLRPPGIEPKPDSQPRDLPLPPSHPSSRGPETIARYAPVLTDERSAASVTGAPERLMRFEEDGGVRLAGGLPGEVLDEDGTTQRDSGGWVVQPPPYQRFR